MTYFVFCLFMVFIAYSQAKDSYEGCTNTADDAVKCFVGADAMDEYKKDFGKCSLCEMDLKNWKSACLSGIYDKYMDNPAVRLYLGKAWCTYGDNYNFECIDAHALMIADDVMFAVGTFNVWVDQYEKWGFDRCPSKINVAHWFCYVEKTDSYDDGCIRFLVGNECPVNVGEKRSMFRKSLIPNHGRLSMKKSLIPSLGLKTTKKSIIPQGKQPGLSSDLRSLRNRKRSFQPNFVSGNNLADLLQKAQK